MDNSLLSQISLGQTNRFQLWVRVVSDPYARGRGYSLLGREFPVIDAGPVREEMESTLDRKKQLGQVYRVTEDNWLRICPEARYGVRSNIWLIPVEFCQPFIRPVEGRATTYVLKNK